LAKAGDALERAARANIDAYPDRDVLQKWDVAVKKRLPDAPAEVLEVMKKATASLQRGGAAAGAAGGVGGRGANANEDPTTELGRAWRRMKKTAPILTVKRDATIFDVRLAYTKQGDVKLPQKAGARSEKIGNLHVAFHGRSVALLEATLKMPEVGIRGGSSVRYRFCAWTLLAKGEVWSVGKDGAVRVRAR